jgi:peptide/nickel transport system substrate-binding protein
VEIDPASGKVVKVIPVGTNPGPMTAGEGAVWVANLDDKTVSEIDPRTGARLADISTDTDAGPPTGIAAGLGSLWVSFGNSGRVDRIDPRSRAITKRLRVHEEIGLRNLFGRRALAVGAGSVWLANLDATVVRIGSDGRAHQKITVGGGHWSAIAVASDGSLWEAVENERSVWHVDPKTNSKYGVVGIGGQIEAIATSPGAVWVIDGQHGQVVRVDPASTAIAQKINVGSRPTAEVLAGSDLWVANSGSGTLSEIDVRRNKVIRTIPLGDRPSGITFASGRLWVSISRHLPASSAKRPPAQVLRLGIPTDYPGPDLIDPAAADNPNGNVLTWSILYATCAKLLNYPDKPGRAGLRPTPEVAMAMPTVADGGKTYTFTIRTGSHAFRFSPPWNTPVTAETFKASIERTLDPAMHSYATLQGLLDDVVGVKPYEKGKVNDIKGIEPSGATLTFRLTRPSQTFLARLSMPQFCAVPADFPRQIGLSQIPAAGPYYVAASSPEGIVLKENPNYHGGRPHHFKEIDFVQGVDAAAVQAGTADNVVVFPTDVQRLMKRFGPNSPAARNGHQRLFVDPVPATFLLVLNTARPLFRSRALRRAVSYAVDRQAFSAVEFGPIATPPFDHYLTPGFPGARTRRVYPPNGNLALARRLASGHGGQAVFYYLQEDPRGEAVIEKALKAIGIDVVRKLFAGSVALAKAQKRGAPFDVALSIPDADYPDPASVLGDLVSGRAIRRDINTNDAYFNSAVYNRKLAKAATLTGPRRLQAYGRLDLELARRESPYVALARWTFENFDSARIGCQVFSPVPHYDVDFAALCLRK